MTVISLFAGDRVQLTAVMPVMWLLLLLLVLVPW